MNKRELRDERRAARQAKERAEQIKTTRRKRFTRLGGAVGLAAVVVVVAAVATSNSAPKPVQPAAASTTAVQERNGVLGDPNAPVTITEYLDLQCPICQQAATTELPTLIADYVKTGKVKLQARTLHFIGDDSTKAARFAAGAERQGKLWPFIETFYANQGEENSGYVTDDFLKGIAKGAGVDYAKANAFAGTDGAQAALDKADAAAQTVGADSTPTFTIKQGNGAEKVLVVGPTGLTDALDAALKA